MKQGILIEGKQELVLSNTALGGLSQQTLASDFSFRFKVKGSSMSPFIKDGDIVIVSPLAGKIRIGMPVFFIKPNEKQYAVHRVIGRDSSSYLLKGDNLSEPDGLVPRENIFGRVTKIVRSGRYFYLGLGPERGLIAILSRKKILSFIRRYWCLLPAFFRKQVL